MEMVSIHGLRMSPSTKIPTAAVTVPTRARETFLDQPNRDWSASAGLSSRLIRDVAPANRTARKKRMAKTCPNGMLRMTVGIVMKRSHGPEFGSIP